MRLDQFENRPYLAIETFRRNGIGVKTPVWFVKNGDSLWVWTQTDSGKAKRIRRDGTVRVAPSTASGGLLGEWITARAVTDDTMETMNYALKQFKGKYGLMFSLFGLLGKARGAKYTAIKILVNS